MGIYVKGEETEKTLNIEKVPHHRNSSFPILFLKAPQLSHLGWKISGLEKFKECEGFPGS